MHRDAVLVLSFRLDRNSQSSELHPKYWEIGMDERIVFNMKTWLQVLCGDPMGRSVGTPANRRASELFVSLAEKAGAVICQEEFKCLDFEDGGVELSSGTESFMALASPFSKGVQAIATLETAGSMAELQSLDLSGKLLLLHDEIAVSQIMPKSFSFYNPDEHRALVKHLEGSGVLAVITASPRQPELNGAVYPTPMFEDGDLGFPSVYMSLEEGAGLLQRRGRPVKLISRARQIPSRAIHAMASFGPQDGPTLLICSHLDSKRGTPGALDNAGGTMVLCALMELLRGYQGPFRIEIMPFNGEDYFAVPGEMIYLRDLKAGEPRLCINLDAVGLAGSRNGWCHFNLTPAQADLLPTAFLSTEKYGPMREWIQGDHAIFAMRGVPTIAFCTEAIDRAFSEITHTAADTPDLLDLSSLADMAMCLRKLVERWGL